MKKKTNIIILVLFHLLVFTFPFAIKEIHHHETNYIHYVLRDTEGNQISKAEKLCPICQFEFVSFILTDLQTQRLWEPVCQIKNYNPQQLVYIVPLTSYLLRAPPLA